MTRSILCGLMAVLSVGAVGALPLACQSGGVGDPCTPEDEYNITFAGFKIAEENIESRSFQCQTRICLVNHFQGRVSCPAGQGQPTQCDPANKGNDCPMDPATGMHEPCVLSQTYAPACTPCDGSDPTCVDTCQGLGLQQACDSNTNFCTCTMPQPLQGVNFVCEPTPCGSPTGASCKTDSDCDASSKCDLATSLCKSTMGCPEVLNAYVCHKSNNCQNPNDTFDNNKGKDCCVPGTDSPVAVNVCGQCGNRNAAEAVYCTCRCCAPCCPPCTDGSGNLCPPMGDDPKNPSCSTDTSICGPACDPNFNYCSCPSGFSCVGIRTNVGLGDAQLAGAYCIQSGTAYDSTANALCGVPAGGFVADNSCSQ